MTRKPLSAGVKGKGRSASNNNAAQQKTLFASLPKVDVNGKLWLPTPYTSTKISKLKKKLKALLTENQNYQISHDAYGTQIEELQQQLQTALSAAPNNEHSNDEFNEILEERNNLAEKVVSLEKEVYELKDEIEKKESDKMLEDLDRAGKNMDYHTEIDRLNKECRNNYFYAMSQKKIADSLTLENENLRKEVEFQRNIMSIDLVIPDCDEGGVIPTLPICDPGLVDADLLNFEPDQ